ncbi:GIY-YIG nuclease family protein [Alicyclobacillus tolerans]|uniref:GIY-YIG domain-containing protein n=1 Tax=Alicyclobacillus tolerans TaxID=90970 RepID=A0A1M6TLU2_9BACL|nr:GIY-YIG nuclease family protein [Alicyclobacillus montanus]SHK57965.1 hypothetical protein SAMN05443507_11713 [Alicyclobacillus montanus]
MENLYVDNLRFDHIRDIVPDKVDGKVRTFFPQQAYENRENLPLHQYGTGPFCRFTIPRLSVEGVYLIRVNGAVKYVGECENLGHRFNMGYGNISPRNCFVGGQPTNCRINHHIYMAANESADIKLYFHETKDRFEVERTLIETLNSEWNIARGKNGATDRAVNEGARSSKPESSDVRSGLPRNSSC